MTTYLEAKALMFQLIADLFVGTDFTVIWPGQEPLDKPTGAYAVVGRQTIDESKTALRNDPGGKFTTIGLLTVNLYIPRRDSSGLQTLESVALSMRDAFRLATNTVIWYRNARINEEPVSQTHHTSQVLVDYEYDEILTSGA